MTRYANPLRCPDCTSPIEYDAAACARCGLPLRGPVAQELFTTLARADVLLRSLRATTVAVTAPARPVTPPSPSTPATTGLGGASVPKILLTLGAGCLLLAAVVFLAVTWSVMGVGGRTATLVGFTVVAGGLTGVVTQRGLRGATEALGLVTLGLLALDLAGADNAGWFGDIDGSVFLVVLGVVLSSAGSAASLLLRRTPSGAFTGGEVVAGIGTALVAAGLTAGEWSSDEARLLISTLVALLAASVFDRLRLGVATAGAGLVAGFAWLALTLAGVDQLNQVPTLQGVWVDLGAWPALAAAGVAAALAAVHRLPHLVRVGIASVAAGLATLVVVAPALDESPTTVCLTSLGVLAVASAALWLLPRAWAATAALTLVASVCVTGAFTVYLLGVAWVRLADAAADDGRFLDRLPDVTTENLAPWVLVPAVVALFLAVAASTRFIDTTPRWHRALPAVGLATVWATAAMYPLPVWVLVVTALVAGAVYVVLGGLVEGSATLAMGLFVSFHSVGLTATALAVLLLAAGWVMVRDHRSAVRDAAGVVAQLALAGSIWSWGVLLDQPGTWVAAVGIVAVGVVPLLIPRVGLEIGAGIGVAGLFFAGGWAAPADDLWSWVAVYLTLAGAAACIEALLRPDRREMGWVGGLLLAAATWVRLGELGVEEPEPYTLPSAVALLVVGLMHLRRHRDASTMRALSPGLGLALVPSLLWVLVEPATLRSALLGVACLALVVGGVRLRWTAPLVFGGVVGAVVALCNAAPYLADSAVPRWVLIGFAGVLLVAIGVTWEQRVRETRAVMGYVRGLR